MVNNNTNTDSFQHVQLDHEKASIRLVDILPHLSPDGLIQCRMFQTTTYNKPYLYVSQENPTGSRHARKRHSSSSYICLSYTWGKPDNGFPIRINGKIFRVRQNLYEFLEIAWRKQFRHNFWIDALCIDQSNVTERNHQVQQMGQIFSQAEEVFMWLGQKPHLEATLQRLNERYSARTPRPRVQLGENGLFWDTTLDSLRTESPRGKSLELAGPYGTFCNDEYWSRACASSLSQHHDPTN
jgi:hypothetical protein